MRKVKEVQRLKYGLGLRQDQIARSCSIGQATVHRYLEKAAAAGLSWPLPEEYDDRRLNELLFPSRPGRSCQPTREGFDLAEIHRQLKSHQHVTLQLLWEEYRQSRT
jgi:transposase